MRPKILTTMQTYTLALFRADIIAGVTVALVAIPLSLAIAIASGATPAQGLITAIIGGFIISLLGGSRVQIGGPTGAFIVVVYKVIHDHGYDGLILATLMAGVILIIVGRLKAGNLIAYVPEPVVNGFTIGIAIIIATSQLKDLFGLTMDKVPPDFIDKLFALWNAQNTLSLSALGVGISTIILIVALRRAAPKFPGLFFAIAITSAGAAWLMLDVDTIHTRFGELPHSLPLPQFPSITIDKITTLLPSAFIIAFLAAVESLLSATVADRMINAHHRPNAEVIAQGSANIVSALFGGMPVTGAIARTATNINAGGKTPVAGLVHAFSILLLMMLAAPLAGYLAMPAMAALLILVAYNMSEPHKWRSYLATPLADRTLLILTLSLTVLVDLTIAIGVGVAFGMAMRLRARKINPDDWQMPKR